MDLEWQTLYIKIVNTIKYNYHSDRFILSIEYKEFRVDKRLKDEGEYVVEAMRKALEVFWGSFFENRKMMVLN